MKTVLVCLLLVLVLLTACSSGTTTSEPTTQEVQDGIQATASQADAGTGLLAEDDVNLGELI